MNSDWKVEQADVLDWLRAQPDDSADLVLTSPPYLRARTYGINAGRGIEDWVNWMFGIACESVRICKGLVAIVCEGQTKNYRYLPSPFLLMARLHTSGYNLRKPPIYNRSGVPGSGGPDWLRNEYEPIICITRPGKLPWSDNTACGTPTGPNPRPRGPMNNRKPNGKRDTRSFRNPQIANPGNIIRCPSGSVHMGHPLSTENEAPFPLRLAEFFVRSFCPPGGLVIDPFTGSGTACHAAVLHGRRFSGCDLRESQVALTARRMASVEIGNKNPRLAMQPRYIAA